MGDLSFDVGLRWSGSGRDGVGELQGDGVALELSVPRSMGGRGVGTNPEELLVSAVSACYTTTLFAVLRRGRLPVDSVAVAASGTVTGYPDQTRFASIVVSPTILGGAPERQEEYEAAAEYAHARCLIGGSLAPEVRYEVGPVVVSPDVVAAPIAAQRAPLADREADDQPLARRSA